MLRRQVAELTPDEVGVETAVVDDLDLDFAVERIVAFNAAMAPFEDDFVRNVERLREIGYGRMIQLILGEWEKLQPGIAKHWGKQA